MEHPLIVQTAEKYGVTPVQLCIRYCVDRGLLPIVKSAHRERMEANLKLDFEISPEDLALLGTVEVPDGLKRKLRS